MLPEIATEILSDGFRNQNVIFTGHHPMKVSELFKMIKEMLNKDIIIEYKEPESEDPESHYTITPYKFIPKMGRKIGKSLFILIWGRVFCFACRKFMIRHKLRQELEYEFW